MLSTKEIINILLSKDLKKLLKLKNDSNLIQTGGKGKRLQQWLRGPTVSLTFNFLVAIAIIFINKWVLKNGEFKYPVCLSFIHYVITWVLMGCLNIFGLIPQSPPTKSAPLFTLGLVMALCTGLANVSLKYNSVGFYQMAKIAVTPSIVVAEFIWYRKKVSFPKAVALIVVSGGIAVATITDIQFNLFGAVIAFAWIIPSAASKILWSTLQQRDNWTALSLMWKSTPVSLMCLAIMIPLLDPPGVLSYNWNLVNSSMIFISGILGFLLQWSAALALGATSAISHVVLGQFKTCILLLGNYYLFGSNPGTTSICGAFVAIAAMSFYTHLNLQNMKNQSKKTYPDSIVNYEDDTKYHHQEESNGN